MDKFVSLDSVLKVVKKICQTCPYDDCYCVTCYTGRLILDILNIPSISKEIVEVVHCKDCKHAPDNLEDSRCGFGIKFPDVKCPCQCDDHYYDFTPDPNWYCGNGERRDHNAD